MPSIGPTLPPHLAKRSRDDDDNGSSSPDSSDKRRRVLGPAPPPATTSRSSSPESDVGLALPKYARTVGPAHPPAPLDERPSHPGSDDDDSESSDDDFGPAPPPAEGSHSAYGEPTPVKSAFDMTPRFEEAPKQVQRDEWMLMPPTQDDLAARMDPSKMRARKFNTGKGAGGGGGMSAAWTETPEQKLKRLQDEAMGISSAPASAAAAPSESRKTKEEERRARRMREKIDASRGKSLVEQHQEKGTGKEKEDDPSKRVFDYEKDMAVIGTANNKQMRDTLKKSKGFGDRFSSGSYL